MPYTKVDHLLYNRYRSTEQLPGIGDNWVENLPSNRPNKTVVSSAKILSSSNKEVQIGGELELQCVAHEEPPFKIWWWLNGTRLDILKYEGNFKNMISRFSLKILVFKLRVSILSKMMFSTKFNQTTLTI